LTNPTLHKFLASDYDSEAWFILLS